LRGWQRGRLRRPRRLAARRAGSPARARPRARRGGDRVLPPPHRRALRRARRRPVMDDAPRPRPLWAVAGRWLVNLVVLAALAYVMYQQRHDMARALDMRLPDFLLIVGCSLAMWATTSVVF